MQALGVPIHRGYAVSDLRTVELGWRQERIAEEGYDPAFGARPLRREIQNQIEDPLAEQMLMASYESGDTIPIMWGIDAVHGQSNIVGATLFPHNIGLGATRNPELLRRIGEITALETRATGMEWAFAPTVAVPQDDRWGRSYEGYSESPDVVASYAGAMVEGLQGKPGAPDFLDGRHVMVSVKHFLGDGGTPNGKDQGDNLSTPQQLRDIHGAGYLDLGWLPFEDLLQPVRIALDRTAGPGAAPLSASTPLGRSNVVWCWSAFRP